ncbi:hypothetical protein, partial [Klebsiella pneumoniae]|uniref:hypothetical protein n=1 Tax=Klebsiella pneumoniae TaxID=573 RepID=UPI004045680B
QTETEATGAPQKHHYTLNQQVGSITTLMISVKMICMMNILSVVQDLSLHLVTYVPQLCFFVSLLFFTCRREFQRISIVELAVRTA